jgi:CMP-N,N'-diacetyllegionaminic acid synthase
VISRQTNNTGDHLKILALIPARGGSKRIPGKNICPLGGRPLILWSINAARGIPEICDIMVSTDEPAIAEIARNAGVLVPWLRPAELASDTATSVDVALHALDWYEKEKGVVDGLLLLQPTSPFRSRETIERGIHLFRQNNCRTVIGVSPADSHPMWCFRIEGDRMKPFTQDEGILLRSQDLPPAYVVNGAFYLTSPGDLRQQRSLFNDTMVPLVVNQPEEGLDIDTEWDWKIAEAVCPDNPSDGERN